MKNYKKICRLLMLIALGTLYCLGAVKTSYAQTYEINGSVYTYYPEQNNWYSGNGNIKGRVVINPDIVNVLETKRRAQKVMDEKTANLSAGWSVTGDVGASTAPTVNDLLAITPGQKAQEAARKDSLSKCQEECNGKAGYNCQVLSPDNQYHCVPVPVVGTSGDTKDVGVITGCTKNTGLFSGLINTGSKIFQGLRDLIYVVAGFGIIGVAVGGFFGNLNWKWLGAIVIALVVIASTGELITAITGCTDFTQTMITDTLK